MLTALSIRNVVLIESLDIIFRDGLCALTGETGAGKSILLDALGLALGARSDAALVRAGAESAHVTAAFYVRTVHPALDILRQAGIEFEAVQKHTEIILRRAVMADGRSRAFINDQPVSVALLKSAGETLAEIHGQFETQGLFDTARHRALLDDFAGISDTLKPLWQAWQDHARLLDEMRAQTEKSRSDEEYLRAALADIDALAPAVGEEETLAARRTQLMSRGKAIESLQAAYDVLNGEVDPVRKAWSILERAAAAIGPQANAAIDALSRASAEIQEAIAVIGSASADMAGDDASAETIDDRLHALRAAARKHGCAPDDLPSVREKIAQQLNLIEHGDDMLAAQIKKTAAAHALYETDARDVSARRRKAATALDALVQREFAPLKLDKARFVTEVSGLPETEWGPHGMDRVAFLVSTNPGAPPGPLGKIASGGEMARFMLALKVVLAASEAGKIMIFDEVDSGMGGAVADAVGERLARLSVRRQLLVITHSPQVAARAAHHYVVRKGGKQSVTTDVKYLDSEDLRREEIARMLSGAKVTDEARAAARILMAG